MSERLISCNRGHNIRLKKIKSMVKSGYIEIVRRSSGPNKDDIIRVARLTKKGFYQLTGTINSGSEDAQNDIDDNDLAQFMLNKLAENNDNQFWSIAEEEIYNNQLSILATEMIMASEVSITPSTKREVLYRNWILQNVQALFMASNYLTVIDRLPMACHETEVKGISELKDNATMNIELFTRYTLKKWYDSHPNSVAFSDPYELLTDESWDSWWKTPAFYPVSEIPGLYVPRLETEDAPKRQYNYNHHRTFIGLATGERVNYLVYYAKGKPSKWNVKIEHNAIRRVEDALKKAYESNEHPHINKSCNYAIMVCHSIHHFHALFNDAKMRMGSKTGKKRNVSAPFNDICIVTLNHSGKMEIRMLMQYSPQDVEDILMNGYVKDFEGFRKNLYDNTYKLTHNGVPVLLAHTLNFQKLFTAMEDYERGARFYVSCFPQQVKFIQQIMPDAEFL